MIHIFQLTIDSLLGILKARKDCGQSTFCWWWSGDQYLRADIVWDNWWGRVWLWLNKTQSFHCVAGLSRLCSMRWVCWVCLVKSEFGDCSLNGTNPISSWRRKWTMFAMIASLASCPSMRGAPGNKENEAERKARKHRIAYIETYRNKKTTWSSNHTCFCWTFQR